MKRTDATAFAAMLAGIVLSAAGAWAGDPIPGVDVSLEQIPGGRFAGRRIDSDADCRAIPGAQVVVVNGKRMCRVPKAISHNSSRSNYSR
ncbi:MAG: hypothetical protein D6832_05660 [Alphaproteobacteria bacterium]|nr:MAG: hypothetical protein D6832_05660 [Alphaproteobacteria bacterium]